MCIARWLLIAMCALPACNGAKEAPPHLPVAPARPSGVAETTPQSGEDAAPADAAPAAPSRTVFAGYAGELPGYTFYRDGELGALIPLQSGYDDVIATFGQPDDASDMTRVGESWTGFAAAAQPVLTYHFGNFKMLIYFVKSGYFEREHYPADLHDRLFSIDLVPRRTISFAEVSFPPAFKARKVMTEASFVTMQDGSGLVYQMWAAEGGRPGNLERISYGPPDRP